jgi:hypothetical protein
MGHRAKGMGKLLFALSSMLFATKFILTVSFSLLPQNFPHASDRSKLRLVDCLHQTARNNFRALVLC